jgi:hypothetical protein
MMPSTTPAAPTFQQLPPPIDGEAITLSGGKLTVPDAPIIPFIEGDGIGPDIWRATQNVLDGAVRIAYGGARRLAWFEVFAGDSSLSRRHQGSVDDAGGWRISVAQRRAAAATGSVCLCPAGALVHRSPLAGQGSRGG